MTARRHFLLTISAWLFAVTVVLVVVPLGLRDVLPEPLATHWNASGHADRANGFGAAFTGLLVAWAVVCAVALLVWWRADMTRRGVRGRFLAAAGFVGTLLTALALLTLYANAGRPTWQQAREVGFAAVGLCLLATVAVAAGGRAIGRLGTDAADPASGRDAPRLDLAHGVRAVWVSRATSRAVSTVGVTGLILAALALLASPVLPLVGDARMVWVAAVFPGFLLVGAGALLTGSVRVEVSGRGLGIALGPWGLPVWRLPIHRIRAAHVERISPARAGGWGLKVWSERTVLMVRGGECLVVDHDDGGRFAVSVDDAETGAALLNTLRERDGDPARH